MIVPPFYVHAGFGVLLFLFSVPLILRRVPMNCGYGIRVPQAFLSEGCWYDINAYGGKWLAGYGLLLALFAVLTRDLAPPVISLWSPLFNAGPLVVVMALLLPINRYARWRAGQEP